MSYQELTLNRPLVVVALVTVHYFEYSSNYYFAGESHDFWELVYVDKGAIDAVAGSHTVPLGHGQMIFHQPGEFHAIRANGVEAPNIVVVSFRCHGEAMSFFQGRILTIGDRERALLAQIIEESRAAFDGPLDDPLTTVMPRRPDAPFGCEQLIACALEELLIGLVRRGGSAGPRPSSLIRTHGQEELYQRVVRYLEDNLSRPLTLADICRDNLVGRSRLQSMFREKTGGGVMARFGKLRVDAARQMIREGGRNFTEIAGLLGYQSIYYFSRHFKKSTGMTPSEYASSVKVLSEKNHPRPEQ